MPNVLPLHEVPASVAAQSKNRKREETLKTKWLLRLLKVCGWNTDALTGKYVIDVQLTGMAGRADLALKVNGRVVACIELKAPNVQVSELALKQAVKYAASYYYVSNGRLDPVMAICTNGLDAYIMDPALERPYLAINYFHVDLRTAQGTKRLISILRPKALDRPNGSLPVIKTQRKFDLRPYASNTTEKFERSVFSMASSLTKKGYSAVSAVEMTVQCLLLAAARDNGIIPNSAIRHSYATQDWASLARHCNSLFGDVFEPNLSAQKTAELWRIYEDTSQFNVRLDVIPAQYMGVIYEKLIKKYFKSKTSFYTPEDMIDTVLAECRPTTNDSILDPTCGSGAFLSKAIDSAVGPKTSPKELLRFFSKVVGVDKDPVACRIAKVTLLCTFMRKVGEDYRRSGKRLPHPQIEPAGDFFDWDGGRFSLLLGNPPWESIDVLPKWRRDELSANGAFQVYQDKNDQLCYILEKAVTRHLSAGGRFGFVIKLQSLMGTQYRKFAEFLDGRVEYIFDYGSDQKFGNYAQSAGIVGRSAAKKWHYSVLRQLKRDFPRAI